jgi:hypothetical protein
MSEISNESNQPRDLGAQDTALQRRAIELLGEENVAAIEDLERQAKNLVELSKLPDPFQVYPGHTESLVTPGQLAAIETIDNSDDDRGDFGSQELIDTMRKISPLLREGVNYHSKFVNDQYINGYAMYKAILKQQSELNLSDTETVSKVLPRQYEMLEEIAKDLFSMRTVQDYHDLLDAELSAFLMDAKSVTVQKNPQIGEQLRQLWEESTSTKNPKNVRDAKLKEYEELTHKAETMSYKYWRVRRAHRSVSDFVSYQEQDEKLPESFKVIRNRGSLIFKDMQENAVQAAFYPSEAMWEALLNAEKKLINQAYSDHEKVQQLMNDQDFREAALLAERYLSVKAESAEAILRGSGAKFNPQMRRALHQMKEGNLKNWIKKFGVGSQTADSNELEAVEIDAVFRKACRDARDILVGGGRIDHTQAKQLADSLHRLRFGKDESITLDPTESGMIVGIITGRLNSLLQAVDRFEAEVPDDQVHKLQLDLPDQYKVIAGFDIDLAINNIRGLLQDVKDRQLLLGSLINAKDSKTLVETIEKLWRQRNMIQEPSSKEANSIESEMAEQTSIELEPSDDELDIISEEVSNIAEQLEWIVFPAGATASDIRSILGENSIDLSRVNWERIKHLIHLADTYDGRIYRSRENKLGTSVPYLVAEFGIHGHNFAVAECPEIGNATYVVDEAIAAGTWTELMRLSKADARNLGARRIIHPKEEGHLNKIIRTVNSMLTVRTVAR